MPSPSGLLASCLVLGLILACPAQAAPPAAPAGLAMTANAADSITLTWYRPAEGQEVKSYKLFVGDQPDGAFQPLGTATERTFTHGKLKPGETHYYKIAAVNADGEGAQSKATMGFTITPSAGAPFPVKIAKNMCLTLGAKIVSDAPPVSGKLEALVDGSDATTCRLRKACDIRLQLDPAIKIADAAYLMLHFRAHGGAAEWSNDPFARIPRNYVISESLDSTDGKDGTWKELASGTNDLLDSVIVLPNHQPKWIGLRSSGGPAIPASDKRPNPGDLLLCRLDVFRAAPAGFRNDYWIFTGDSLVVQDMPGGGVEGRSAFFSDLIRQQHPDRYPIVVHAARGGEMMSNTIGRMKNFLPVVAAPNGTPTPTGTILCFESGFNDVGVGAGLWTGGKLIKTLTEAQDLCASHGIIMVPVRIEFSNGYLNPDTLEPVKENVFYNTLAANLAGVDVFCRTKAPYACNVKTQLPFADYWSFTRKNHATVLNTKDGVHHTKEGSDGINRLWAEVADQMVYTPQK